MNDIDLAYAAGLIDGEGCIQIIKHTDKNCRRGYKWWLNVTVSMCDREAVDFLRSCFGGCIYTPKRLTIKNREIYRWSITTRQAGEFLDQILPYLIVKKELANIAVKFQQMRYLGSRKSLSYLNEQDQIGEQFKEAQRERYNRSKTK